MMFNDLMHQEPPEKEKSPLQLKAELKVKGVIFEEGLKEIYPEFDIYWKGINKFKKVLKMKDHKIILEIRSVLINDWDPVKIGENPNLIDEYDSYIGLIIKVLIQNSTVDEIVELLKRIETKEMGIENFDIKTLHHIAIKLKKIGNNYY